MWGLDEGLAPQLVEMSAIAYSHGRLFACGYLPDNDKYWNTWAILGIASSSNTNQAWESIGYTQEDFQINKGKILFYYGCMNISAYGTKVFASDNSESDTENLFPYTAMVYESTIQ
jgi:hypothetical protein